MRTILIASALVLSGCSTTAAATGKNRVEIDGHTFQVRVKGRAATVADKALVTSRSPEQRDRMMRAVVEITGCQLSEPYWEDARLRGLLNCGS